jgi:phosphatidylserine/phosphatidylglycerophosphate/cardiolipin synthase-like enzyme
VGGLLDNTRKTYFSPDDDTQTTYLNFVQRATKKILIADYSFNLEPLAQLLISRQKAGLTVRLVLDRTQAAGPTERPVIDQLKVAGIDMVVGTSSKRKIMHDKFTITDDEWVQSGSWNYTAAASREDNFFDIEHSVDRASKFTAAWQKMYDWIKANEPQ